MYYNSIQLSTATRSSIKEVEKNKSKKFSADAVRLLHTSVLCKFTMASCWKTIYQELKKVIACDMTVWSIMVKGYQIFVVVWNCSSKFAFIDKRSSNSEYPYYFFVEILYISFSKRELPVQFSNELFVVVFITLRDQFLSYKYFRQLSYLILVLY